MAQNFTIDDSDPTLVYSSGWGVDSTSDPALDNYFQSTYHATQTLGSNVSLSFSGSAIYLFGSTGPDHGNFSVRYDNLVQLLTSRADTLSYRQLLFSTHFTGPGTHSLTLTYTDKSQGWFDLDFVTVTGSANTTSTSSSGFASTISPPPLIPTTTEGSSPVASNSGAITTPASSVSTHNTTTFILAIVFGALLLVLAVVIAGYLIIRRRRRRQNHRPKAGTTSYYGGVSTTHAADPQSVHSAGSAFLGPQSIKPLVSSSSPESSPTQGVHPYPHATSPVANVSDRAGGGDVEMRQWGGHSVPGHALPLPAATRPWSPFSTPMNRMFGAVKDGADSMKSTFLKV